MNAYESMQDYIFVSYSHKDSHVVIPVINALKSNGFHVWYDLGLDEGRECPKHIESHLLGCAAILVFISPSSIDSVNCRNEIDLAQKAQKKIFSVYLEPTHLEFKPALQLNAVQAFHMYTYPDYQSFIRALCKTKIFDRCREWKDQPDEKDPNTKCTVYLNRGKHVNRFQRMKVEFSSGNVCILKNGDSSMLSLPQGHYSVRVSASWGSSPYEFSFDLNENDDVEIQIGCDSSEIYTKQKDTEKIVPVTSRICNPTEILNRSDEYDMLLDRFIYAVEADDPLRYSLYERLKEGTDLQKTKLGFFLAARRNVGDPKYEEFEHLYSSEGVPLLPCLMRRGCWMSFLFLRLEVFPTDDFFITFSSDVNSDILVSRCLKPVGSIVYRSSSFGWLGEEKKGVVFHVDRQYFTDLDKVEKFEKDWGVNLQDCTNWHSDYTAYFVENGEKEYSAEITAIVCGKMYVLLRYTVGGCDKIKKAVEPEIIHIDVT